MKTSPHYREKKISPPQVSSFSLSLPLSVRNCNLYCTAVVSEAAPFMDVFLCNCMSAGAGRVEPSGVPQLPREERETATKHYYIFPILPRSSMRSCDPQQQHMVDLKTIFRRQRAVRVPVKCIAIQCNWPMKPYLFDLVL